MRRYGLIPAVLALVILGGTRSIGAQLSLPGLTGDSVVGELVDHACYLARELRQSKGAEPTRCGTSGAQKGNRLAVVTDKGDVYLVIGDLAEDNNAKLIPMMNRTVVMTGTLKEITADVLAAADGLVTQTVSGLGSLIEEKPRRGGQDEGVVVHKDRKGEFREGDLHHGLVRVIEATGIELSRLP